MEQKNQSKLHSDGLLVFILTIDVFGITNTEMGVVGILPLIAETFDVLAPRAGWMVSIFALVVAVPAPATPLLFLGVNRKKVMLLVLGLSTLGNIMSMLTTNFTVLLVTRILPVFLHPVYVSMAFTVAAVSISKEEVLKTISRVFVGVSAGMVLDAPVTSFITSKVSFSMSMLFSTVANTLVLVATALFIPSIPVKEKVSYGAQLSVLKRAVMWNSIIAITLINGTMFGFFSYVSGYLKTVTEISYSVISAALLVYDLASIVGNILTGKLLSISAQRSIIIMPLALLVSYICLFITGEWITAMVVIILILGVLAGIASSNMQYMIAEAAPEAPDFTNGMFLASANLGTTIGTAVCEAFITETGIRYSVLGALFFLIASIVLVYLRVRVAHLQRQVKMNMVTE